MNFNKHISPKNEVRYSYFEPLSNSNDVLISGLNFGNIVLMDEKYNIIKKISLLETVKNNSSLSENHEFIYFDDNHYIITGAIDKSFIYKNSHTLVKAAYFQEVKDDQVIFEWCSIDEPSLIDESVENNNYIESSTTQKPADYVHINSIDIDSKDNNFICSFRNQDSIAKISRETGEILWKLGGLGDDFNLTEQQKTSRQHYAKYQDDGSILVFDNGNKNQSTRVVKYILDESNKKVIDFKEYKLGDKFYSACGSVQAYDLENEIFTIGWGVSGKDKVIFSVIDFKNNEILSELYTDKTVLTYRSLIY